MAGVHGDHGIVPAQAKVRGVRETRSVGVERAAKAATPDHVELAVPALEREADLEVDGLAHVTEHPTVGGQVGCSGQFRCREEVCGLDPEVGQTGAILYGTGGG